MADGCLHPDERTWPPDHEPLKPDCATSMNDFVATFIKNIGPQLYDLHPAAATSVQHLLSEMCDRLGQGRVDEVARLAVTINRKIVHEIGVNA